MKNQSVLILLLGLLTFVLYTISITEEHYMNPYRGCPVCEVCPICKTCEKCPPPPKCPPCLDNTKFEEQKGFVRGANTGAGIETNFFDPPCYSKIPQSQFPLMYGVVLSLPIFLIYLLTSLVGSRA